MQEDITLEYLSRKDTILANVLDCIFDGVYITDKERKILFWNKGAEEITGHNAKEVMGSHCYDDILNHIDQNGVLLCKTRCPLAKTIETGESIQAKVYPLHKSKKRFPVMTHIGPITDKNGNIIAGIEVFRDISKEEDLRILQEKFNNLIKKYVSSTAYEIIMEQIHTGVQSSAYIKDLTILYLDIIGFTTFSEKYPPEDTIKMLNDLFGICEVITKECYGDIDKFIGDALMAVFIDANDAIKASKTILFNALPELNKIRIEENKEPINLRIGINSGMVIQGDIGTIERKDLTVIGDVVNTSERIEEECESNSILISESTYSRLNNENSKLFKSHDELSIRGKIQQIKVYKLIKS